MGATSTLDGPPSKTPSAGSCTSAGASLASHRLRFRRTASLRIPKMDVEPGQVTAHDLKDRVHVALPLRKGQHSTVKFEDKALAFGFLFFSGLVLSLGPD